MNKFVIKILSVRIEIINVEMFFIKEIEIRIDELVKQKTNE
jgi:hypothetical protein